MKAIKLIVVGLIMFLGAGSVYAGGYLPGVSRCHPQGRRAFECGMLAYQACAAQLPGVSPASQQFKACQDANKVACMVGSDCPNFTV